MARVSYEFHVNGLPTAEGKIPVRALLELLRDVTDCAERGLRLALEGASVKTGRTPAWLSKAVDLTFAGIGTGCTKLVVEAPTLGDVLGDQISQQDFFIAPPSPDETALSLFSRSVQDAKLERLESDYFDTGVLKGLLEFRTFFKTFAQSVEIVSADRPADAVTFGMAEIQKAESLRKQTPEPRAFVVSGHLESISHRKREFQLDLADGQSIHGRINEEFITAEELRSFWGRKVSVKGMVHFRPSGRVRLLDAQALLNSAQGDEVFGQMPTPQSGGELFDLRPGRTNAFAEVRGKWPGDESIEDILDALRND